MSEWLTIMNHAHAGGLTRMDELVRAAERLAEGDVESSLDVFDETLAFCDRELHQHFRHEEQALFPALARFIGRSGPIGAMLGEHESLWRNVDEFAAVVTDLRRSADGAPKARGEAARLARHIAFLLRGHIDREDNMLFPLAERTLDGLSSQAVAANMAMLDQLEKPKTL